MVLETGSQQNITLTRNNGVGSEDINSLLYMHLQTILVPRWCKFLLMEQVIDRGGEVFFESSLLRTNQVSQMENVRIPLCLSLYILQTLLIFAPQIVHNVENNVTDGCIDNPAQTSPSHLADSKNVVHRIEQRDSSRPSRANKLTTYLS